MQRAARGMSEGVPGAAEEVAAWFVAGYAPVEDDPQPLPVLELPGYPFATDTYWPTGEAPLVEALARQAMPEAAGTDSTASATVMEPDAQRDGAQCGGSRAGLETVLRAGITQVLQVPEHAMTPDAMFSEYGFDSLSLAEYARVLTERLGVTVLPDVFFGNPTLERLAEHLVRRYPDIVMREETTHAVAPQPAATQSGQSASVNARSGSQASQPGAAARVSDMRADGQRHGVHVVGAAGLFPGGARSRGELWHFLAEGRCAVAGVPGDRVDRWIRAGLPSAGLDELRAGFLRDADVFDPEFFGLSPREADAMDPRQRLLLQETWHALEDAQLTRQALVGRRVDVYVGAEAGDYQRFAADGAPITASSNAVMASRFSYFLDLTGISVAIDTACSSGLVAMYQAAAAVREGRTDVAVVAGVNLLLAPESMVAMRQAGMLSETGRCAAFSSDADGMVPAEAVAVVVLASEETVRELGLESLAEVTAAGANYDGRTNGITAPSGEAQTALLRSTWADGGVDPSSLDVLFSHGTGTRLGDPVELNALVDALGDGPREQRLRVVSTKPALGHALAASGLVSVIALVESLRRGTVPPSLHLSTASEYIRWNDAPVEVLASAWDVPGDRGVRRGAVSAFGMSGTNAHVVLDVVPLSARHPASGVEPQANGRPVVLMVSARSEEALRVQTEQLATWLSEHETCDVRTLAHVLAYRRTHFAHRVALVVSSAAEAAEALRAPTRQQLSRTSREGVVASTFRPEPVVQALFDSLLAGETDAAQETDRLTAVTALYVTGYDPAWGPSIAKQQVEALALPGYPFTQRRFWVGEHGPGGRRTNKPGPADETSRADETSPANEAGPAANTPRDEGLASTPQPSTAKQRARIRLVPPSSVVTNPAAPLLPKPRGVALQLITPAPATDAARTSAPADAAGLTPAAAWAPVASGSSASSVGCEQVRDSLVASLADALFVDAAEIDVDRSFTDLGLDSIVGVEWTRALSSQWGVSLESTRVYQYPTVREFAGYLSQLIASQATAGASSAQTQPVESQSAQAQPAGPQPVSSVPPAHVETQEATGPVAESASSVGCEQVRDSLVASLADALFVDAAEIDVDRSFTDLGLDSIVGVEWTRALSSQWGVSLESTRVYQYPTVREFAGYLSQLIASQAPAGASSAQTQPEVQRDPLDDLLARIYAGETNPADAIDLLERAQGIVR